MPLSDNHRVIFDGSNKLIIAKSGTTLLDVKQDLYSDWKEWIIENDNAKYLQALRTVGGDPISGSFSLGSTFFLTNNWKIRPYEGNHTLDINGNLFVDGGGDPFVSTTGSNNVLIRMTVSNLIDTIETGVSGSFTSADRTMLNNIGLTVSSIPSKLDQLLTSSFLSYGNVISSSNESYIWTDIYADDKFYNGNLIMMFSGSKGIVRTINNYCGDGKMFIFPKITFNPVSGSPIFILENYVAPAGRIGGIV